MPTIMALSRRRQRCSDGPALAEKGKKASKALARALELNDTAPKDPEEDKLDKHGRAERAMAAWPPTARDLRAWMDVLGIS